MFVLLFQFALSRDLLCDSRAASKVCSRPESFNSLCRETCFVTVPLVLMATFPPFQFALSRDLLCDSCFYDDVHCYSKAFQSALSRDLLCDPTPTESLPTWR